jgi:hypothetical protein
MSSTLCNGANHTPAFGFVCDVMMKPMAYIAIVHVKDADAAKTLATMVTNADGVPEMGVRMVGLYRWPTPAELTCLGFCSDGKLSPWSFGKRGMTCGVCGGRHVQTKMRVALSLLQYLGDNLLKNAPNPFRNPTR